MFDNFPLFNQQQFQNPYPQFQNQYNMNQFVIKQVTNINEAKNAIINPLSIYLFVDYSNGNIYLKKMNNNNGLSDFIVYSPQEEQKPNDPFIQINERLTNIENKLGGINVQSISNAKSDDATENVSTNAKSESSIIQQGSGNDARKK